ncbi:MAG: exo-alpha-sialidase [Chloroflexi bacterium]|nr:exo-alpha-sialidase [Chloroflexota bacterium]
MSANFFRSTRRVAALALPAALLLSAAAVFAAAALKISVDPYTNVTSQHQTQVEPDSFAYGSTLVAAVQTGRFYDGGASNIAWSTSADGGLNWTTGYLPGITKYQEGGPYDRVSDPAVAYDARHNVWMISSLAITESPVRGAAVLTSRSTDGGLTWGSPVTVTAVGDVDKNWIVCDNHAASVYFGNCYTEWDDVGAGGRVFMSTSSDGGLTWGARTPTVNNAGGIGGQPVVQPDGTVVVPMNSSFQSSILAFRSTDGGATWTKPVTVSAVSSHRVAGNLRTSPLPSAEVDATGRVYVVWQDCRFRIRCKTNDIVMSTSTDGVSWTAVVRIPIDIRQSRVDHFIPGLAVDPATAGAGAHLALTYYYYPNGACSAATCKLSVGFVSSADGGASWTRPQQLAGPMTLSSIASTSQGRMVGDYISTSFSGGLAYPFFSFANALAGSVFDQALYTTAPGIAMSEALDGAATVAVGNEQPVPNAQSDRPEAQTIVTQR